MVAAGTGTASVTVEPFAAIAPGYTTVFTMGVPTGVRHQTAQGIVLALPAFTNASAGRAHGPTISCRRRPMRREKSRGSISTG